MGVYGNIWRYEVKLGDVGRYRCIMLVRVVL